MGLLEALRDPQFRSDLGTNARQLGQSASNTIAEGATMPVDALAWLLRRSRVNVPQNPIGGSDWAKQQGLMADVPQGAPKMAGEALGLLAPLAGTKQGVNALATALRQGGENLAAPAMLNKQAGAINVGAIDQLRKDFPEIDFFLSQNGDKAVLSKVVVPKSQRGEGVGTSFMNALTKEADKGQTQLALSPSGDFGGNKARLIEFYKRFGFVPNKGKNIDFSISESMRREPLR